MNEERRRPDRRNDRGPDRRADKTGAPENPARRGPGGPRPDYRAPRAPAAPAPEGRLVVGLQPVRELLRVRPSEIRQMAVVHGEDHPKLGAIVREAAARGIPLEQVFARELDRRTGNLRHQGVAAWASDLELLSLEDLVGLLARSELAPEGNAPALLALDGIMDPQNFGAIVRSAVALGVDAVLWPEHASAPLSPAMFRASAGAVEHARLCRVPSLPEAMRQLVERAELQSVLLEAHGEVELGEVDLRRPTLVIVGSEDRGARRGVRQAATVRARLPMSGRIGSLNASVACALALYEMLRQRAKIDANSAT